MTIRDLVRAYVLADGTVASLLGARLYPDMLPQKVTYPAATIQSISVVRPGQLKGRSSRAEARIQFDVYAAPVSGVSSRGLADMIAAALRLRLAAKVVTLQDTTTSPATDVFVQIGEPQERDGVDPETNGGLSDTSTDFIVSYQTHGGTY